MRLLVAILLLLIAAPASAQQSQGMSKAMVVGSCGGGTLPNGSLNQLTMNPAGQLCLVGISGGGGGCSQATAYLARATGETTHAADLTTLICGLVTDGVWTKLDALYVLAQQTQADAQLNLIGTSYSITISGAPTFTSYRGFSGFSGNAGNLSTNFNAATATTPQYTLNSASYGVWSYQVVDENVAVMGNGAGGSASIMYPSFSPSSFYARVNEGGSASVPTPGTKGLFVGDRPSSSLINPYWNGVSQGSISSTAAGLTNNIFLIGQSVGARRQDEPAPKLGTSQTLCEAHIGASLGAAGNLAIYNRLRAYMTAVGVP